MIAGFVYLALAIVAPAHAEPANQADLKAVTFNGEIVSKSPYKLKFTAPAGHHFNKDAPPKVEVMNDKEVVAGTLDKSEHAINVDFPKTLKFASNCSVNARLFVCNDANTYCLPIRKTFDCQNLKTK